MSQRTHVIMGIQGGGKGTQSGMLAEDLDLVHITVGDIFRWNVQHHTKLGAQVRRVRRRSGNVCSRTVGASCGHNWQLELAAAL